MRLPSRPPVLLLTLALLVCTLGWSHAAEWTIRNPHRRHTYTQEPLRLRLPVPDAPFRLLRDGEEVPYQIEQDGDTRHIRAFVDLEPGAAHTFTTEPGTPTSFDPAVRVQREGAFYILSNDKIALRIPAESKDDTIPAPVDQIRLDAKWLGRGHMHTKRTLTNFRADVVGDGTITGRIRLHYTFEGTGGGLGDPAAHMTVEIELRPGMPAAHLVERHAMERGAYWEFEATAGWGARQAQCEIFGGGAGRPPLRNIWPTDLTPLGYTPAAIAKRYEEHDPRIGNTLLWLVPRWNQHYRDGWFFGVHDETDLIGAIPCDAGTWVWPHNNKIEIRAKESADYAGLRCPVWKGARSWLLVAGPLETVNAQTAKGLVRDLRWNALDTLVANFILDWDGASGHFQGHDFFSDQVNPTGIWRRFNQQALDALAKREKAKSPPAPSLNTLTSVQVMLHPDMFGSYWSYWSPQNPNFFSDFIKRPIVEATALKDHPRFEEIKNAVVLKLREDLYHGVTMPGGAGQECPGYQAHALKQWDALAPIMKTYYDFDLQNDPRYKAAHTFLERISQPRRGGKRVFHPGGDTHPGSKGPNPIKISTNAKSWVTEELPGFGILFRRESGTDKETYLAFKAGPNRGHYHGDQLSFHLCFDAAPVAVDHHVSYNPRPGQEHMHNRVVFSTPEHPYMNMDGYERTLAFETSDAVDVAIAQVESERLRPVKKLPPEDWDVRHPQLQVDTLRYRRTIVFLKEENAFVLRDQHDGADLTATYTVHVLGDEPKREGNTFRFKDMTLVAISPETFEYDVFPFEHNRGGGEKTHAPRLSVTGPTSTFVTVILPAASKAEVTPVEGGVRVGATEVLFDGGIDESPETVYVHVRKNGDDLLQITGAAIDLDRPQGEVGLFVPDAGYPFGEIPDWLMRQRATPPDWAPETWPPFAP